MTFPRAELEELLGLHQRYLDSVGSAGKCLELVDADLRGIDFRGRDLSEAFISGGVLDDALLVGVSLFGAELEAVSFAGADLTGARLAKAECDACDFTSAILRGVAANQVSLVGAVLRDADLTGSQLTFAYLIDADLRGAIARDVDFYGAGFSRTRLGGADLRGIKGLDALHAPTIDIGDDGEPNVLEADAALAWLQEQASAPI